MNWITLLQKLALSEQTGSLFLVDRHAKHVMLTWNILTAGSPSFEAHMLQIADLATAVFTGVETDFLKTYPEAIKSERLYQHMGPLFENIIDWQKVKESIHATIYQLYTKTDWSKFGNEDIYIFITAHYPDQPDDVVGFVTFLAKPGYAHGNCKIIAMGVHETVQRCGIGTLLMNSIFTILPKIERIFLCTRVTNTKALNAYYAWGFKEDLHPLQEPGHTFKPEYWKFLELETRGS